MSAATAALTPQCSAYWRCQQRRERATGQAITDIARKICRINGLGGFNYFDIFVERCDDDA